MSIKLVALTPAARAHSNPIGAARAIRLTEGPAAEGLFGLTPAQLHTAYQLPTTVSSSQTIALVDAYNDPNAAADLATYSKEFKLPECTEQSGCFKQVNQYGSSDVNSLPFPKTSSALEAARAGDEAEVEEAEEATGWGIEMSLDIETAHATCQSCDIVLVEADSPSYENLETAEATATEIGATEISNSWGGPEAGETLKAERESPFDHPGTVITASAGDNGYLNWDAPDKEEVGYANFPASSPHVIAVGGTHLELAEKTAAWKSETVWDGLGAGGGGCSKIFEAPTWQQELPNWSSVGCGSLRAVADVSADADPYSGLAVYDSTAGPECEESSEDPGWCTIGGTSLASPLIASVYALAGGAGGVEYPARTLYENESLSPASLHDITTGSNGKCSRAYNRKTGASGCSAEEEAENSGCVGEARCLAGNGYDGPTGVGTPDGIAAFEPTGKGETHKSSGSGLGSGGQNTPPSTTVSSSPTNTATNTSVAPAVTVTPVQISALALTTQAIVALNNSHPKVSRIGFVFTINADSIVRLTLTKRARVHRRMRWITLQHSLAEYASMGRNTWHLRGRGSLAPGDYRITLTPAHATARSLTFQIG